MRIKRLQSGDSMCLGEASSADFSSVLRADSRKLRLFWRMRFVNSFLLTGGNSDSRQRPYLFVFRNCIRQLFQA